MIQTRTVWPAAEPLQQAADIRRAAGDPLLADWLDETANALAWLAPYRDNEPGYGMWQAVLAVARQILGTTGEQPAVVQPEPAVDRAAILREAADALDESETLRDLTDDHMHDVTAAANELRRMADGDPS